MPHMIRMSVERLSFVALRLTKTLFIYLLKFHNHGVRCCETSSREQIIQNKGQALKELEKRTPHRDVAFLFGVPKNTLSTRKKKKYKIFEKHSSLMSKRVKPEKYEELNKAVHKWFLNLRSDNVPISGPMFNEKGIEFAGGLNIGGFQASEGWLEKWKKCKVYISLYF